MKSLTPFVLLLAAGAALAEEPRPLVIAHRGASGYLPEHTLAAKALAHGLGADFLEQDLVLTKDDVPVVLHDIYLDTVTDVARQFPERKRADGRYYALDLTLAELKQLHVTERFNPQTGAAVYPGRFPAGQSSFQISTLEEELQLIQGLNRSTGRTAGIYPEIKQPQWHRDQGHDISRLVLPVLARYGYATKADVCWLQCFELAEVRRLRGELGWRGRLVMLLGAAAKGEDGTDFARLRTAAGLDELAGLVDGIGPPLGSVVTGRTKADRRVTDLVALAHARNLVVHPYTVRVDELPKTVESIADLHAVLFREARVDGVFTDFPEVTAAWLRGASPPLANRNLTDEDHGQAQPGLRKDANPPSAKTEAKPGPGPDGEAELRSRLNRIRHVALDMDGTIYKGNRLFDCTNPFLARLATLGIGATFLTNNSSKSVADYVNHLRRLGVPATAEQIFTSTLATVEFLREEMPAVRRLFVLGTASMSQEMAAAGYEVTADNATDEPDAVLVGFDTGLSYPRLCRAAYWIGQGKPFLASHPDLVCPTDLPTMLVDCGAICAALQAATGRKPAAVVGKPDARMLRGLLTQHGLRADELAMVGDRLYTDIAMGQRVGALDVLVLTGEATAADAARFAPPPSIVVPSLAEFGQMLHDARPGQSPPVVAGGPAPTLPPP